MAELTDRAQLWRSTMSGFKESDSPIVLAHEKSSLTIDIDFDHRRESRELHQLDLSGSATLAHGSGDRNTLEDADPVRTCFEKDRDRILHSSAFRRLAGKTQVFVFPADHQRTRLTHALEVAQVARSIGKRLCLNVDLCEAIALGHDCGHGPGGHASEDALSIFLDEGYDHAIIGARYTLQPLNLCKETIDGIENHSWSRPEPLTPEGLVVSWADRIAYCAHDLEDAISAHLVAISDLPKSLQSGIGITRSQHLNYFINAVVEATMSSAKISMLEESAYYLAELRDFNYRNIYLRPESTMQSEQVIGVLRSLTEFLISNSHIAIEKADLSDTLSEEEFIRAVVTYVGGMTDRYAFKMAAQLAGYDESKLPRGIDIWT